MVNTEKSQEQYSIKTSFQLTQKCLYLRSGSFKYLKQENTYPVLELEQPVISRR